MPQRKSYTAEAGNVFLIILIGIVLFAALSFTIARGFRSETTNNLSDREAALAASDILAYAQRIERAVNKIRRNGVSENDISFAQNLVAGYAHAQPDEHKVFNSAGGSANWQDPPKGVNDGTQWLYSGGAAIRDQDTATEFGTANPDLVMFLGGMKENVCREINKRLGHGDTILTGLSSLDVDKFTGSYPLVDGPSAKKSGCMEETNTGNLFFLHILIER